MTHHPDHPMTGATPAEGSRGESRSDGASTSSPPEAGAGMALYTFDCRRADGTPVCLEMHELISDERALVRARKLLDEHLTCSKIEVFEGERPVGAVARDPDGRAQHPTAAR